MGRNKVLKVDLIEMIMGDPEIVTFNLPQKEVWATVSNFLDTLSDQVTKMKAGDRIELRGFGTFIIRKRKARVARNPKSGEKVDIPERNGAVFKPGREMRENVRVRR